MRWPWDRPEEPEPERDEHGIDEASSALDSALAMWPEVRSVTEQMKGIRRRNHLAEITVQALRGNR